MGRFDVWVIPNRKVVEVTEFPGPPAEICGYVSPEAAAAAQARGWPNISEIGFPADLFLGGFDDLEEAFKVANARAAELGFKVIDDTDPPVDFEDEEEYEYDFEDYGEFDDEDDLGDEYDWDY